MFVYVFSTGSVQEALLEHLTESAAANLSMTCRGLRSVFKQKLHSLHELRLDVDTWKTYVETRDMIDRLNVLSTELGQVRKIRLKGVTSVSLAFLVTNFRTSFTQLQELKLDLCLGHADVIGSHVFHWLPDSIQTLQISSPGLCAS